jgi:hypothetical protein
LLFHRTGQDALAADMGDTVRGFGEQQGVLRIDTINEAGERLAKSLEQTWRSVLWREVKACGRGDAASMMAGAAGFLFQNREE